MMIKAGIVVSAAAATLLAVSPLAFAGDYQGGNGHHKSHHSKSHDHDKDKDKGRDHRGNSRGDRSCDQDTSARGSNGRGRGGGLINISGNTVQVPVQACNNNVLNNIGFGLLGRGSANGG
jgi:hypothetical protein